MPKPKFADLTWDQRNKLMAREQGWQLFGSAEDIDAGERVRCTWQRGSKMGEDDRWRFLDSLPPSSIVAGKHPDYRTDEGFGELRRWANGEGIAITKSYPTLHTSTEKLFCWLEAWEDDGSDEGTREHVQCDLFDYQAEKEATIEAVGRLRGIWT